MFSKHLIKISAALAIAFAFGSAGAQTLTQDGMVLGTTTKHGFNGATTSSGSYAPGRQSSYNGGSNFWAFCIDPKTLTTNPLGNYSTISLDTFLDGSATSAYKQQLTRPGQTYTTSFTGANALSVSSATQTLVLNDLKELFSYAYTDAISTPTKAAAFGMAVWEIILQDGGSSGTTYAKNSGRLTSFGSSSSNTNDTVDQQTSAYLSALNTGNWSGLGLGTATNWNYTVYFDVDSPFSQTFIGVTTPGVPEPGTAALAALALLGAVRFSRRNTKA